MGLMSKVMTPERGKQAPFIRTWNEYSEGDFNIIMKLQVKVTVRHFLIHQHRRLPQMFLLLFQQFVSS